MLFGHSGLLFGVIGNTWDWQVGRKTKIPRQTRNKTKAEYCTYNALLKQSIRGNKTTGNRVKRLENFYEKLKDLTKKFKPDGEGNDINRNERPKKTTPLEKASEAACEMFVNLWKFLLFFARMKLP